MTVETAGGANGPVHVYRSIPRVDARLVEAFRGVSAATAHEGGERKGALDPALRPLDPAMRVCGPAVTVLCPGGDNLMIHKAVALAEPGDVLVVAVAGNGEFGYCGDILATAAQARGLGGLVIDGCVRDRDEIVALGFPVFSAGLAIRGADKANLGLVNHPLACGGQIVWPGDLILGDADGVVAIGRERAEAALKAALARDAREEGDRAALTSEGQTTLDRFALHAVLATLGMTER